MCKKKSISYSLPTSAAFSLSKRIRRAGAIQRQMNLHTLPFTRLSAPFPSMRLNIKQKQRTNVRFWPCPTRMKEKKHEGPNALLSSIPPGEKNSRNAVWLRFRPSVHVQSLVVSVQMCGLDELSLMIMMMMMM